MGIILGSGFFGTSSAALSCPNQSNEYLHLNISAPQPCAICLYFTSNAGRVVADRQRDHLENLTSKIAYRRIQPVVPHRCVTKFADYHLDWSALWRNLDFLFVDKPIWKSNFLNCMAFSPPWTDWLAGGLSLGTCAACGQPETQEHLLEHCPLTLILVDWFEELLGRKWPDYRLSNTHLVWSSSLRWVSGQIQVSPGNSATLCLGR